MFIVFLHALVLNLTYCCFILNFFSFVRVLFRLAEKLQDLHLPMLAFNFLVAYSTSYRNSFAFVGEIFHPVSE